LLEDNIPEQLQEIGFTKVEQSVLAGSALQRITARCPNSGMLEGTGELS
jgi:demethylmenaquinone methyltransferase/2-methoxy-6-polyprenyl-1,4-benzoquinol methylase